MDADLRNEILITMRMLFEKGIEKSLEIHQIYILCTRPNVTFQQLLGKLAIGEDGGDTRFRETSEIPLDSTSLRFASL